jgi:CHASE2 domain-containing sensor protein
MLDTTENTVVGTRKREGLKVTAAALVGGFGGGLIGLAATGSWSWVIPPVAAASCLVGYWLKSRSQRS